MTKKLLMGTAFLLCFHSAANAQTDDCGAIPLIAKIAEIGAFTNMRFTQEHAYGYRVMLWRAGKCVIGFFESSEGLAGDTPIGELLGVKYDEKGGALSFSAKLTTGLVSMEGSKGFEPSRDLFTFVGHLQATRLTGVVTHANQNKQNVKSVNDKVVLRASKEESDGMHGSVTYGEWRQRWQPVLRFRGPRW